MQWAADKVAALLPLAGSTDSISLVPDSFQGGDALDFDRGDACLRSAQHQTPERGGGLVDALIPERQQTGDDPVDSSIEDSAGGRSSPSPSDRSASCSGSLVPAQSRQDGAVSGQTRQEDSAARQDAHWRWSPEQRRRAILFWIIQPLEHPRDPATGSTGRRRAVGRERPLGRRARTRRRGISRRVWWRSPTKRRAFLALSAQGRDPLRQRGHRRPAGLGAGAELWGSAGARI